MKYSKSVLTMKNECLVLLIVLVSCLLDRQICMTKLLIIQRIFADYRKPVFDRLNNFFDLRLLHSHNTSGIKQIETTYSKKVSSFSYTGRETNLYMNLIGEVKSFKPQVIIHELALGVLSMYTLMFYSKLRGMKFILWGHGFNHKKGFNPRNSISDKLRLQLMKRADAVLLYGTEMKNELGKFIQKDKIYVARNTIDTKHYLELRYDFEKSGKKAIKQELGFEHEYNLVYIGRLIESKSPLYLLEILNALLDKQLSVAIHFIGSGEEEQKIKNNIVNSNLENHVNLHGSIHNPELSGKFLFASDLMVMPGYLGLSVNHAFCFGCPVVSFKQDHNGPFHSPEVENVVNNKTGYLADKSVKNDMINWIYAYLKDKDQQSLMTNEVLKMANNEISIDSMVDSMKNCIEEISKK